MHLQRIMMLPPREPRAPRVRITATETTSASSASTTSAVATIAATAAMCGTPLFDVWETGTIGFCLPDVVACCVVCDVFVVGCFFLCVCCVCRLTLW
jgi:hypothetical protein